MAFAGLPRCHHEDFLIWNEKRKMAGGFLKKRAGGKVDKGFRSLMNRGKWQRRWFIIDTEITGSENYELSYFYTPDDAKARAKYPLAYATVLYSGGDAFQIQLATGEILHLSTEREDVKTRWFETLLRVIKIASAREDSIQKRLTDQSEQERKEIEEDIEDSGGFDDNELTGYDDEDSRDGEGPRVVQAKKDVPSPMKAPKGTSKALPSVRLDVDIGTIPPSSTQRRQFEEMFISDISKALDVEPNMVEIHAIKPVIIMSWLVEVTFDIVLHHVDVEDLDIDKDSDVSEDDGDLIVHALNQEREGRYDSLMGRMHDLVTDTTSIIYNGFITCKLDPSYSNNLIGRKPEVEIYSSDRKVLEIMHRYKDVPLPSSFEAQDPSHFNITLSLDGVDYPVEVPNPTYMRQRHCFLWPFEVKKIVGLCDTMQEQWVEPVALHPVGLPRSSSHTVRFEPSHRMEGEVCLNTSRLQPGVTYEVEIDDLRSEVLMNLTDEQMYSINETFKQYDVNQDGTVSKSEIEKLVRERTKAKKDIIEGKFNERITEPGLSEDEIAQAEEQKRQHLQACNEAQAKQLKMFAAADMNGDGSLSLTEFMLAESWWLRCTLNPEKAHLF